MDILSVSIRADTSGADRAVAALDKMTGSSRQADGAVRSLGTGYDWLKQKSDGALSVLQRIDQMTSSSGGVRRAAEDIEAYGAEMDRLRAKYNPAFASSQAYGRELEGINYAHRVGAISAQEQASAIAALDARYKSAAASADTYQASAARVQKVSGDGKAHTTNLMFQAQDIAMMTAMGQNPMMLAMQQGSQVGPILQQMGGGRAAIAGVGAALASLVNPINLITLGVIGFGAAGVQALMKMIGSTDDASSALEKHNAFLDKTLEGYDKVRDAADHALEAALKLPTASAASSLGAQRDDALESQTKAIEKALELRREFEGYVGYAEAFNVPPETIAALEQANSVISRITEDSALSRQELDQFHVALTELGNNTADQNIKAIVAEALALIDAARQATAEVASLDAGLNAIDRDIQIRISMSQEFGTALDGLSSLYQDPRNRFDIMREQAKNLAEQASASAVSYGQAAGAGEEYARVLESINAAEAAANAKAADRAKATPMDRWGDAIGGFQQRIEQQRMEIELLGKSTFEAERQRAAFDLLAQAKRAGLQVNDPLIQQINQMSSEYANLVVQMESASQAQALLDEQLGFYRSTFTGLFGDLKSGLQDGQSMWEALGNAGANALDKIADRALSMAANGLFDMIFGAIMGGVTGGIPGLGGGMFGKSASTPLGFGGTKGIYGIPSFDGGGWTGSGARSGGLDGMGGFLAMMHPQEMVRDTTRSAMPANDNGRIVFAPVTTITIGANAGVSVAEVSALLDQRDEALREQLPSFVQSINNNPRQSWV